MRTLEIEHLGKAKGPDRPETIAPGTQVICAHPSQAQALGVPYCSLDLLARQHCQQEGWQVLSPLMAYQERLRVLEQVLKSGHWPHLQRQSTLDLRTLERQLRSGITALLRSPSPLCELAEPTPAPSSFGLLVQVSLAYEAHLEQRNYLDPAQVYQRATQLKPRPRAMVVLGYPEWIERQPRLGFLDAIAGAGSVVYLASGQELGLKDQEKTIAQFETLGWTLERPEEGLNDSAKVLVEGGKGPQGTSYLNQEEEVRGVLRELKRCLLEGVAPDELALVTWDEAAYAPMLLDIAWEYELPLYRGGSQPLLATPLGFWIKQALDMVRSRFEFETTAGFLRHPLTPSEETKIGPVDWAKVRESHPQSWGRWRDCGANLTPLEDWTRGDYGSRTLRQTWVQRLRQLLQDWQVLARVQQWPDSASLGSALDKALEHLAGLPQTPLSLDQFARELLETFSLVAVVSAVPQGAITLQSPAAVVGARYRHLWLLGVAEGITPSPLTQEPLLDWYHRKQLQNQGFAIETAVALSQRQLLLFAHLSCCASQLHLSYPRQIQKTPMLPSPYLARLGVEVREAQNDGAIASWQELRQRGLRQPLPREDAVLTHAARSWSIELHRQQGLGGVRETCENRNRFQGQTEIPVEIPSRRFSASQLTHLGQCAFKWFAGDLLKIQELREAETELSGRLRGRLYHKTLELATQKALETGSTELRQALLDHLDAAFLEAEELEQLPELAAWGARRQEHLQRLRRTLAQESFLGETSQILSTERPFEGEWYGFRVRGVVDRVDRTPDGYVIIEYKSRSSRPTRAKTEQGKADLDVQLPLYGDVLGQQLQQEEAEATSVRSYYYSLTKAKPLGHRDKLDREALQRFSDRLKEHLTRGDYPVEPDRQYYACQYCPHDVVCRVRR